jgi:hypothetical protein
MVILGVVHYALILVGLLLSTDLGDLSSSERGARDNHIKVGLIVAR